MDAHGNGASGAQGKGASANGGQHRWRTWQSDDDIPQRKILIQHMCVREATRGWARE